MFSLSSGGSVMRAMLVSRWDVSQRTRRVPCFISRRAEHLGVLLELYKPSVRLRRDAVLLGEWWNGAVACVAGPPSSAHRYTGGLTSAWSSCTSQLKHELAGSFTYGTSYCAVANKGLTKKMKTRRGGAADLGRRETDASFGALRKLQLYHCALPAARFIKTCIQ